MAFRFRVNSIMTDIEMDIPVEKEEVAGPSGGVAKTKSANTETAHIEMANNAIATGKLNQLTYRTPFRTEDNISYRKDRDDYMAIEDEDKVYPLYPTENDSWTTEREPEYHAIHPWIRKRHRISTHHPKRNQRRCIRRPGLLLYPVESDGEINEDEYKHYHQKWTSDMYTRRRVLQISSHEESPSFEPEHEIRPYIKLERADSHSVESEYEHWATESDCPVEPAYEDWFSIQSEHEGSSSVGSACEDWSSGESVHEDSSSIEPRHEVGPPQPIDSWRAMSYAPQAIILLIMTQAEGSFNTALRKLGLNYSERDSFLWKHRHLHANAEDWNYCCKHLFDTQGYEITLPEDYKGHEPVLPPLIAHRQMHHAAHFLDKMGLCYIKNNVLGWANTKPLSWPLHIPFVDDESTPETRLQEALDFENNLQEIQESDAEGVVLQGNRVYRDEENGLQVIQQSHVERIDLQGNPESHGEENGLKVTQEPHSEEEPLDEESDWEQTQKSNAEERCSRASQATTQVIQAGAPRPTTITGRLALAKVSKRSKEQARANRATTTKGSHSRAYHEPGVEASHLEHNRGSGAKANHSRGNRVPVADGGHSEVDQGPGVQGSHSEVSQVSGAKGSDSQDSKESAVECQEQVSGSGDQEQGSEFQAHNQKKPRQPDRIPTTTRQTRDKQKEKRNYARNLAQEDSEGWEKEIQVPRDDHKSDKSFNLSGRKKPKEKGEKYSLKGGAPRPR
ncbi:uncharacterized protein BCR38DRAFT_484974 [Pseudomassariella vexata]|uniref:Uncharacterized protein n=1 Tax=Pseudomassariella vexata TaxID=1141098 RepID=A0A1Y2E1Y8_9PEZI|nr:uncharacterized protein BCR38DRAFT_484974 [Pseudomassariella vexata]ORY65561.1 hypothetical protein BCR38DRAFT_484974 [Pseudomassariella vexata]